MASILLAWFLTAIFKSLRGIRLRLLALNLAGFSLELYCPYHFNDIRVGVITLGFLAIVLQRATYVHYGSENHAMLKKTLAGEQTPAWFRRHHRHVLDKRDPSFERVRMPIIFDH
jgi:hypothetical protein